MSRYPDAPGAVATSPTSQAAAASIAPNLSDMQTRVLRWFEERGRYGATDEELVAAFGAANTWRPRRVELTAKGLLRDSGLTRKTASGRSATVWIAA